MSSFRFFALIALPAVFMIIAPGVKADIEAQPSSGYTATQKFGRGLAGITLGFLEIPGNIYKETKDKGAIGVPVGLTYGIGMTVVRELVGVYDFLTAPFPLGISASPPIRPEYPWGYFQQ